MSRFDECMADIRRASAGTLSDDEIMEMLEEMDAVARATTEQRPYANVQEELFGHAEKLAKNAREQVLLKARAKIANPRKAAALRTFADAEFVKDPAAAPVARVFGALGTEAKGGKLSVFNVGRAQGRQWIGSLENALTKENLFRVVQRGALDEQIAMEMWELGRVKGGKVGISGSKEAQAAARIIHRLQEAMISRLNRAGAFIRRMPGYIVRQSHDARRIKKAGFEPWFAVVKDKVDEMKTFGRVLGTAERETIYRALYMEFAAGRHPTALSEQPFRPVGGNLAKQVSEHRELHFKTGKDWHDYHRQFGRGTILEAVAQSAQSNGRASALLETFGDRPEEALRRFVQEQDDKAVKLGTQTSAARFRFSPDTLWAIASGEGQRPADEILARLGGGLRSWQVASKMGSAVLTAYITDPALNAIELGKHGVPFMRRATLPFQNLIRLAHETGQQRELANNLQAVRDGMLSDLWGRYDLGGDGLPGVVSWMARKTIKWSSMERMTDRSKGSVAAIISHQMAENTGKAWTALDAGYRQFLEAYGFTEADWPRMVDALIDIEGVSYVIPHQLKVEQFGDTGSAAGRMAARRERDALATKISTFIDDRMSAALNEPGARTRAIAQYGQRGTLQGEFFRTALLFKSFPVELLTRVYGEKGASGEYAGLAAIVLSLTALGFVTNIVRDASKGIAPPDYENLGPQELAQLFMRAMATGGGLGLVGDFFLGEYNRYGGSLSGTMLGPVFGQADAAATIYAGVIRGEDASAKALRALYTNTPFINLWWARTTFDYFILYPMQEWLNPGFLARMERKREQDTGQKFILSPANR